MLRSSRLDLRQRDALLDFLLPTRLLCEETRLKTGCCGVGTVIEISVFVFDHNTNNLLVEVDVLVDIVPAQRATNAKIHLQGKQKVDIGVCGQREQ